MDIKAANCVYKLAGRCNRNLCRFLHRETPSPSNAYYNANTAYKYTRKLYSSDENTNKKPHSSGEKTTKYNSGSTG